MDSVASDGPSRIALVADHVAHLVLMALCRENPLAERQAHILLDKLEASQKASEQASSAKRKAEDLLLCAFCDLDPDYDCEFWDDHDENIHGEIDSAELRLEYPEGYVWSCCQKHDGDAPGCVVGQHEAVPGSKRAKTEADAQPAAAAAAPPARAAVAAPIATISLLSAESSTAGDSDDEEP